jgi:hypothetical protein
MSGEFLLFLRICSSCSLYQLSEFRTQLSGKSYYFYACALDVLILIVILDCECVENLSLAMHLLFILFILHVIFEHKCVGNFTVSFCVVFMPFILIVILEHECLDNFTVSRAYVLWI